MAQLHCLPSLPNLDLEAVHVFSGSLDLSVEDARLCLSVLSADEVERSQRFRDDTDRAHFIAARGILRHLVEMCVQIPAGEIRFTYGSKGKPCLLSNAQLEFNISHSHGVGAWAVTQLGPVGVDVEWTKRNVDMEKVGRRFFSNQEWRELQDLEKDDLRAGFFNCWTRKEAFVKALGDGLSFSLKAFDVSVGSVARLDGVAGDQDPKLWSMYSFQPMKDYQGAVAFPGDAPVRFHALLQD